MNEHITTLSILSGKSYEICERVYHDAQGDLDTAAIILLSSDKYPHEIKDYEDFDDSNDETLLSTLSKTDNHHDIDDDEVVITKEIISINDCQSSRRKRSRSSSGINTNTFKECEGDLILDQNLILIPYNRLQDILERVTIPPTVQFKQIWTAENVIPIPGGVTICEVTSDSQDELDTFLSTIATYLLRYRMSSCFNIESITKRASRLEYLKKMKTIFPDIMEVDSNRIIKLFQDQVIFTSSIVYDDTDTEGANQLGHIITVTLTGLPELLLVMQDASQSIAAAMSSSPASGNSITCVPSEWSLLCHTTPYALVLLEPNGVEWNSVLENGRWSEKTVASVVKCIHRIENIELWRCYCSKRDGIERLRGNANEKWYWHGTRGCSPEVIAKEGFDFRVANPGSYGRGAYFAHSINYSSNGYQYYISNTNSLHSSVYPKTKKSAKKSFPPSFVSNSTSTTNVPDPIIKFPPEVGPGDSQLILARVCLGKTSILDTNMSLTRPPDGYDSVTGNSTMSIVYDLAMAYPSYIITYR